MADLTQQKQFISDYGAIANQAGQSIGIPGSWVLGEWAVTTNWGSNPPPGGTYGNIPKEALSATNFYDFSRSVAAYTGLSSGDIGNAILTIQSIGVSGVAAGVDPVTGSSTNKFVQAGSGWLDRIKAVGVDATFMAIGLLAIAGLVWSRVTK